VTVKFPFGVSRTILPVKVGVEGEKEIEVTPEA
jgi:hypothetical protein